MRKRDRFLNRIRPFVKPDAPSSASPSPSPAQPASSAPHYSSPLPPTASNRDTSPSAMSRSPVLEKAIAIHLQKIPESERAAFKEASKVVHESDLLDAVRAYDATHMEGSSFRPHAERISKFLGLLNRFMGGVAIGIQASPEISSLVVGAVRIVIDLALNFTTFFSRLTEMICSFADYLGPLAEYAKAADTQLVEKSVLSAYANVLNFGWKARRVFVDVNGEHRRWASLRSFMRQHWETFESEFTSIKEDLQHHLDVLLHSVQARSFNDSRKVEQRKERTEFLSWISSIDVEKAHQDIYAKKHSNTCDWLLKESKYQDWFNNSTSSLLWCHGKPGIGKSVLASNVIEHITTHKELQNKTALCFAYYNYQDKQLGDITRIIDALIKQLCRRRDTIPQGLLQIMHDALSPALIGTQEIFISLIEELSEVYLVFDALDECPKHQRKDILNFITKIVTAPVPCHVKVFVTSRREMDISKAFEDRNIPIIPIKAKTVTTDIEIFVRSHVTKLRKGEHGRTLYVTSDDLAERIIQTLAQKADGMFLWVNLQLETLYEISQAQRDRLVEDALTTLPQGLPDTYVRILERIEGQPPYMKELALNSLAWIIYARRPLSTKELQTALAAKPTCNSRQDLEIDHPKVILEACGNLLEEAHGVIRPIHYSVQEFLGQTDSTEPEHSIRRQTSNPTTMHTSLSQACLKYINLIALASPVKDKYHLYMRLYDNPFALYATQNFDYHVSKCDDISRNTKELLEKLLQQQDRRLAAVLQIRVLRDSLEYNGSYKNFDPIRFPVSASTIIYSTSLYEIPDIRKHWLDDTPPIYALHRACSSGVVTAVDRLLDAGCNINEMDTSGNTPLYFACTEGHLQIIQTLLHKGADLSAQGGHNGNALQAASAGGHEHAVKLLLDKGADVNAQGGHSGNALYIASEGGHKQVVKLLLDWDADVNARGGHYGSALQAASEGGHKQVVKLLLDKGADVNAQGAQYNNVLYAASKNGYEEIVKLLLDKGADVNVPGRLYDNALQVASAGGYEQIVKLLLDNGANVNAQSGHSSNDVSGNSSNALYAASERGHEQVVKLLLDKSADVNAPGGVYGNALQAASEGGHEQVVKLLLNEGADVNAQGGQYGNALQAASGGNEQLVKLLLDKGADVNMQGGYYGNALYAASERGHGQVVKLLLDKGANVNAQGRENSNALQAASAGGYRQIVRLLLEKGADVNMQGGHYGNALYAASERGYEQVVKLLLDKGADVNAPGGLYGNALQAALAGTHEQIAKLLLDKDANVNAQGGHYGNALQAASAGCHEHMVKLLLDKGAGVNTQGGHYGNALRAASAGGYEQVAKLLLDMGADVNAQGGYSSNNLYIASEKGYEQVVKLLLEKGADANALGGFYGNALQAASEGGHEQVVKVLLDKGADINAQGGHYGNALQAAVEEGHEQVVKLLLDKGADLNAQGGYYSNVLYRASEKGYEQVVKLLLEKGADANAPGGFYGNALQAASEGGHEQVVSLLIFYGASY